ncbi:GTP-binding protein [Demequina lignilytica]|uniref:ATP/GTP-binding protein n=1 Tax=Demequina lignilytica TaxID=3051663 RepID=A0AB35MFH8_9MICO|nr:ATP/GTP-binding protein [Demequina sp. SYSU T0a273]MDN4482509.1 ATP/GTP-binding protein [Demequina sp. SYSU T0a273]
MLKVVVAGPFGSGKTTFVSTASGGLALGSEHTVSDATRALKESTTTAMDHGAAEIDGTRFSLFGTPGQERFSFMWPVLAQGMHGYVLVLDASRLQARAQLRGIVRAFASFAPGVPFVLAANRWDCEELPAAELAAFVGVPADTVVACDPRDPADCRAVLGSIAVRAGVRS